MYVQATDTYRYLDIEKTSGRIRAPGDYFVSGLVSPETDSQFRPYLKNNVTFIIF